MDQKDTVREDFPAKDIVFSCNSCGKSLVINALGAGLMVTCPYCGAEQRVPLVSEAPPSDEPDPGAPVIDAPVPEREIPEISDVLTDARDQIKALTVQVEELQLRRRFLEKRHALANQNMQALRRELQMIRNAVSQMDEVLKNMEDPSAGDTQPMT